MRQPSYTELINATSFVTPTNLDGIRNNINMRRRPSDHIPPTREGDQLIIAMLQQKLGNLLPRQIDQDYIILRKNQTSFGRSTATVIVGDGVW